SVRPRPMHVAPDHSVASSQLRNRRLPGSTASAYAPHGSGGTGSSIPNSFTRRSAPLAESEVPTFVIVALRLSQLTPWKKASRSALTWSFWMVHMPCGAPLYSLRVAFL